METLAPPPAPLTILQHHASFRDVSLCPVDVPLDAGEEIVIVVNGARCCEVTAFDVGGWVADAITLGPLFVALSAWKGTGSSRAAGATVFVGIGVALGWVSLDET